MSLGTTLAYLLQVTRGTRPEAIEVFSWFLGAPLIGLLIGFVLDFRHTSVSQELEKNSN